MLGRLPTRFRPDPYLVAMLGTVLLAAVLPARGWVADGFDVLTKVAVGLLFFLYGARLSPQATLAG